MDPLETMIVTERQRLLQEDFAEAGAARALIDEEPPKMCRAITKILAIDRNAADNVPALIEMPDPIAGPSQPWHEISKTCRHLALESGTEADQAIVEQRMHLNDAADQRGGVALPYLDAVRMVLRHVIPPTVSRPILRIDVVAA